MNRFKQFIKESNNYKIDVFNSTEMKNNKKIKKNELSQKFLKDRKLNNYPSFNRSNFFTTNKKRDEIKKNTNTKFKNIIIEKFGTNNPINNPINANVNVNKSNNTLISIKPNNNKCLIKNKNNKLNKNKKEQDKKKKRNK